VQTYSYDAWGNTTGETVIVEQAYGWVGNWEYYSDEELGLRLLGLRWYDPETGRFVSRDPIQEDGGLNLYGYVGNSAENGIDPVGLYDLFIHESKVPPFNFDRFARNVEQQTFHWPVVKDWGRLYTFGNPAANLAYGRTGRAGISMPEHASSWQHKLGKWIDYGKTGDAAKLRSFLERIGIKPQTAHSYCKWIGTLALIPTIVEGEYDLIIIGQNFFLELVPGYTGE